MAIVDQKIVDRICIMKSEELTKDFILELIANKKDGRNYTPHDIANIKENTYANGKLKEAVKTTIGCLLVNKLLYEHVFDIIGFVNEKLTKKKANSIFDQLGDALMEDRITSKDYIKYIDRREAVGNTLNTFFVPSPTINTFIPPKKMLKRKKELLEEYKDELAEGNEIIAAKIEKELIEIAREELGDDPGMDLYNSGAKASFDNNFKNSCVMVGPVLDPTTGKFDVITNSYYEGLDKSELHIAGTAFTGATYAKGVGTQTGGAMVKQANAAFQSAVLDKAGTDCGTNLTMEVELTESNYRDYLYRYIVDNGELVMLDSSTRQYIGKKVAMRDPMCCNTTKLCSKCAGEFFYKIGIDNIGLTAFTPFSSLLNKSMKRFHDMSIKIHTIDDNNIKSLLVEID